MYVCSVGVCVCVVWAQPCTSVQTHTPDRGIALTQAGARPRSAIPPPTLLAPALPFSFSK